VERPPPAGRAGPRNGRESAAVPTTPNTLAYREKPLVILRGYPHSCRKTPIWEDLDFLRLLWTGAATIDAEAGVAVRLKILEELRHEDVPIEQAYL